MINLKKVLSGSIGKNLLEYSFPKDAYLEGGAQPFMYETLQSKLLDEEKVDNFLNAIVEKVEYVSTYSTFSTMALKRWSMCQHIPFSWHIVHILC